MLWLVVQPISSVLRYVSLCPVTLAMKASKGEKRLCRQVALQVLYSSTVAHLREALDKGLCAGHVFHDLLNSWNKYCADLLSAKDGFELLAKPIFNKWPVDHPTFNAKQRSCRKNTLRARRA